MRKLLWCLFGLSMGVPVPGWAETYHIPGAGDDIAYVLLHSAGPGDIIEINTGGELGAFNVTDETGLQIIVSPAGLAPTSTGVGGPAAMIQATGVTISGLSFRTSGPGIDAVVEVESGGSCTFDGCTITATGPTHGIFLLGPATLQNCTISGGDTGIRVFSTNLIIGGNSILNGSSTGIDMWGGSLSASNLSIQSTSHGVTSDSDANAVFNNCFIQAPFTGLLIQSGSATLTDCHISSPTGWAMFTGTGSVVSASLCTINGLMIFNDAIATMQNCTLNGRLGRAATEAGGMYCSFADGGGPISVEDCTWSGDGGIAVQVVDATPAHASQVSATGCEFHEWDTGVYADGGDIKMTNCSFFGGAKGIDAINTEGLSVSYCNMKDQSLLGISSKGTAALLKDAVELTDNLVVSEEFADNSSGIYFEVAPGTLRDPKICTNTISGWGKGLQFAGRQNGISNRAVVERNLIVYAIHAGVDLNGADSRSWFSYNVAYGSTGCSDNCDFWNWWFMNSTNQSVDPQFCGSLFGEDESSALSLQIDSPCSAGNSGAGGRIGARNVACAYGSLSRSSVVEENATVTVLEDVMVPVGLVLELLPGATLRFDDLDESGQGDYSTKNELRIEGTLIAGAAGSLPVNLTSASASPSAGAWGLLRIGGNATVELNNAVVEYGKIGVHYLSQNASNTLENVVFRKNELDDFRADMYIGTLGPAGTLRNCTFGVDGPYGARIHYYGSGLSFLNCSFTGTAAAVAGIIFRYSGATVDGGSFTGFSPGSGIVGENSVTPTVRNATFSGNSYGLQWTGSAGGVIESCTFSPGSGQPTDIWTRSNAFPVIRTSTFNASTGNTGIRVDDAAHPDIGPNNIIWGRRYGVSTSSTSAAWIHSNQLHNCMNAVYAQGASAPRIRSNVIDNSVTAIKSASTASPDLGTQADPGNNDITGSQVKHVDGGNGRIFPLMAELNWWGPAPEPVPGKFTANVDYTPWLQADPFSAPGLAELAFDEGSRGKSFAYSASPNPTRKGTRFLVRGGDGGRAQVRIFDIQGRLVRTLEAGGTGDGASEVGWDGTDLLGRSVSAGVYLYRVEVGEHQGVGRIIIAH